MVVEEGRQWCWREGRSGVGGREAVVVEGGRQWWWRKGGSGVGGREAVVVEGGRQWWWREGGSDGGGREVVMMYTCMCVVFFLLGAKGCVAYMRYLMVLDTENLRWPSHFLLFNVPSSLYSTPLPLPLGWLT